MDTTSIILAGTGVIQSLLLLLLQPNEETINESIKMDYDNFMKMKDGLSGHQGKDELIEFISDDGFKTETYKYGPNWNYLATLKGLKETIVKFYFKNLENLRKEDTTFEKVSDVYNRIGQYLLQLMRFRMVIQPEIQISKNVHPRTDIHYLAVKAYWIDESGKKVRKFTKSLGRAENYPKGIEDKQAFIDGVKLIQPVLFETYKELYTE